MQDNTWKEHFKNRIISSEELSKSCRLSEEEKEFFKAEREMKQNGQSETLDFAVTRYFLSLSDCGNPVDPIKKQFMPSLSEFVYKEYELPDPLGESEYMAVPGLIHRYKNRALLLVTGICAVYCRYCFRRHFTGRKKGIISRKELVDAVSYMKKHNEIEEVLLSGGDPLVLPDSRINDILSTIKNRLKKIVVRIGTRIPSVLPQRVTGGLISVLKLYRPLWIITQFNHPEEFTGQSVEALSRFIDAGIPVLNQSVLLKGINDDLKTLAELSGLLVKNRVKPYYIFQGDLAKGTSHFRVPLKRGLKLIDELSKEVSGIGMPVYAVDLPGGGGKISLPDIDMEKHDDKGFIIKSRSGKKYFYPDESR